MILLPILSTQFNAICFSYYKLCHDTHNLQFLDRLQINSIFSVINSIFRQIDLKQFGRPESGQGMSRISHGIISTSMFCTPCVCCFITNKQALLRWYTYLDCKGLVRISEDMLMAMDILQVLQNVIRFESCAFRVLKSRTLIEFFYDYRLLHSPIVVCIICVN